ncbi:MAG: M56 family metallopeptidase [Lachnospiraceae bacterium]|nr:M56 family metallopeptidase [Lachnospiraceae bacterium]
MPLLVTMSIFGSVGTLIYFILLPILKKYFSVTWRRNYLICVILEYLIPFPCFNVKYKEILRTVFSGFLPRKTAESLVYSDDTVDFIQITFGRVQITNSAVYIFVVGVIVVGLILYGFQIYRYLLVRYYIRHSVNEVEDKKSTKVIHDCVSAFKMTKYVRVYRCKYIDSPFTIGILRSIIALPDTEWSESDLALAMKHELTHIRHRDNLIKMLALGVIALNFYNPLVYFVLFEWNNVVEQACDRKVILGLTEDEAFQYGLLVIKIAEDRKGSDGSPVMGLNLQNKIMKERLYQMKFGIKKESLAKKFLGVCIMGVVLFTSSLSVLAYSPKNIMFADEIADKIVFCKEGVSSWTDTYSELDINGTVEWIFISEDGAIVEIVNKSEIDAETYALCNHSYVSGELAKHFSYADGSCKIEYYSAQKCSKCGNYIIGDLLRTLTSVKCTH